MLVKRTRVLAFSLIELLTVIAIMAVLLGLLLAAIQRARDSGARLESSNNLRQIILATHGYAQTNADNLPLLIGGVKGSLHVSILPFLEQGNLFTAFLAKYPQTVPNQLNFGDDFVIRPYLSPADPTASPREGITSYPGNAQVFFIGARFPLSFADGTSNTLAFGEHFSRCSQTVFNWLHTQWAILTDMNGNPVTIRRATFADGDLGDAAPPIGGKGEENLTQAP